MAISYHVYTALLIHMIFIRDELYPNRADMGITLVFKQLFGGIFDVRLHVSRNRLAGELTTTGTVHC